MRHISALSIFFYLLWFEHPDPITKSCIPWFLSSRLPDIYSFHSHQSCSQLFCWIKFRFYFPLVSASSVWRVIKYIKFDCNYYVSVIFGGDMFLFSIIELYLLFWSLHYTFVSHFWFLTNAVHFNFRFSSTTECLFNTMLVTVFVQISSIHVTRGLIIIIT